MRTEGFAPIGGYGVIGDSRAVALVAANGAIDWWAFPAMDAPPVFAALLDPAEGRFTLEPETPYQTERRYLPESNVLETTFVTSSGQVRVVDAMNRDNDGLPSWTELMRRVHADSGEVAMRWRVIMGSRFCRARPWAREYGGTPVIRVGDRAVALVLRAAGQPRIADGEVSGRFIARPGADALLALAAAAGEPIPVPSADRMLARQLFTEAAWQRWSAAITYGGPRRDLVIRSALVLKLLTYAPSRGLMAAATSSLPERIGGERNYDYRYGWIRDTSFALDALLGLGLWQEAHGILSWMLRAVAGTAPEIRPFYSLCGQVPGEGTEPRLRGYRDSRPVRAGNSAVEQTQWGNFGDLLESVWLSVDRGLAVLDAGTARMLESLAERVCDIWPEPDSGMWELGVRRHYTISKIGCWAALDRMVRLADRGQVATRDVARWRTEAVAIRQWIDQNCWSEAKRCYTFYAGSDDLDASVLLAARMGFSRGDDQRFRQTVDAIRAELARGPLVYRYTGADKEEGAFLACSFWLVDALVRAGYPAEARRIWDGAVEHASDLGLLSEELDPASGELRGNMPQALSHLALVTAACQLDEADRVTAER